MPLRTTAGSARTRSKDALSELRRVEILEAATRVFGLKGFHATRAEDIAAAAHIAKGTLYLYFKSKEAIYTAAVNHSVRELSAEFDRQLGQAIGLRQQLRTAIQVRLEFWQQHPNIYRLLLTVGREPKHRKQTSDLLWAAQHEYRDLFAAATERGELTVADVDELAWLTLDLVRGSSQRRLDRLTTATPQQDADRITELVLQQTRQNATKHA